MSKVVADNWLFSLSEWYSKIDHQKTEFIRKEDNEKRDRLEILHQEIGLPYDRPDRFPAQAVKERSAQFLNYLQKNARRLCAFRLVPKERYLPKLRLRGKSVAEALEWFDNQSIDFNNYTLEIVPHTENTLWSSIFIITKKGVVGEIITGGHSQLTLGQAENEPLFFKFDFKNWDFSQSQLAAENEIKRALKLLQIENPAKQKKLFQKLNAKFINNYLAGYFEFVTWPDNQMYFIDYNRLIADLIDFNDFIVLSHAKGLRGIFNKKEKVVGRVMLVEPSQNIQNDIAPGSILICQEVSPQHLPMMKKLSAIISQKGGLLSHAAIVARELGVPYIVADKKITKILKHGDKIEIDLARGIIKII